MALDPGQVRKPETIGDTAYSPADAHAAFENRHPPPKWLLLAESRALGELALTSALWPWLQLAPRGDGHPVVVMPGLATSDGSTRIMRTFLSGLGYKVQGWYQGYNYPGRSDSG